MKKNKLIIFYVTKALFPGGNQFYLIKTNNPKDEEKDFAISEKMFADDEDIFPKSGNKIVSMIQEYMERELVDEYEKYDFKFVFNAEFSIQGDVHPVLANNAGFKFNSHQSHASMRFPMNETDVKFFFDIIKDNYNLNYNKA